MLSGRDIIYFANDWAAGHKTSSHHIAQELVKKNRILYVETGGMRPPKGSGRDLKRIFARLFSWLRSVRKVNSNFYIYSLFILPFHNKWVYKLNIYLNISILKGAIKRLKFKDPILWFVAPHVSYFADHLPKGLIVYYCTDNMAEAPGANKKGVERSMDYLLKNADAVFATSESFCEELKQRSMNSDIYYSPHAVDFQHFSKAQDKDLPVAAELKLLKRPVIGFIGLIEEKWIDLELVSYIARSRPDWSIVLIGRAKMALDTIAGSGNIKYIGCKNYEDLPAYLKGFDVCIIPFCVNELTRNSNPIKLKEYLAAGKPVVTTRLPEADKFKGLVDAADSYADFVEKIEEAYRADNGDKIKKRMESVRGDTWPERLEKISGIIESKLKERIKCSS